MTQKTSALIGSSKQAYLSIAKKNLEQNPKINKVNNFGKSRIKFKLMD